MYGRLADGSGILGIMPGSVAPAIIKKRIDRIPITMIAIFMI